MPIELLLSPIMRPLVLAKAVLFHPHRETSRYVPNIIDVGPVSTRQNPTSVRSYTIRREFGQGAKIYGVFDDANPISHIDQRLYWFVRSRAVKGAYKMYTTGEQQATAHIRAGLRSNILMIQSTSDDDQFELGWHVMGHRVDAVDSYRLFELKDGFTYQWTTKGRYMEKVHNLGEKESEVRERVAAVTILPGHGFQIQIDESKVSREMALTTAMISFIDQWNTQLGVGGIYYPYQPSQVRWKRD